MILRAGAGGCTTGSGIAAGIAGEIDGALTAAAAGALVARPANAVGTPSANARPSTIPRSFRSRLPASYIPVDDRIRMKSRVQALGFPKPLVDTSSRCWQTAPTMTKTVIALGRIVVVV